MKRLILILAVMLVCVGCKETVWTETHTGNFVIGIEETRPPSLISEDPILFIMSESGLNSDNYEHFTIPYNEEEHNLFLFFKEIYCSDNPYAKELIEKYNITSGNIKCKY